MPTITGRLQRLRNRRLDPLTFAKAVQANEVYERIQETEAIRFLIGAMQPIDPQYTLKTYEEANRVRDQLKQGYPSHRINASFDYQGSVTNDTHILAFSDIDLLSVNENFVDVETWASGEAYSGNPTAEMLRLRSTSVYIIRGAFPTVTIDDSGSTAVKVEGGSLRRKIDVVVCNRWNTDEYVRTRQKHERGICVFNKHTHERVRNKPFLHNVRIDARDALVSGNLRKAIRLLKSLRYDANETVGYEKVKISSYDIAAIAYSMPMTLLMTSHDQDLRLAQLTHSHLTDLENNTYLRGTLKVPNETRLIFCSEGASLDGLRQLNGELRALLYEVENDLRRSFRKLSEARIRY